jgi:hypothetical protein
MAAAVQPTESRTMEQALQEAVARVNAWHASRLSSVNRRSDAGGGEPPMQPEADASITESDSHTGDALQ